MAVKHTLLSFSSPSTSYCADYARVLGYPHEFFDLPDTIFEMGQVGSRQGIQDSFSLSISDRRWQRHLR